MLVISYMDCRPGKLLRFDIGPGGMHIQCGQPTGADLVFTGVANQRRGRADVYSKVIYLPHSALSVGVGTVCWWMHLMSSEANAEGPCLGPECAM